MLIIGMGIHKDNDKPKMIEKKKLFFWVGKEQNGPTANDILYYIHFESSKELAILHHKYGGPTHHPHRQSFKTKL